MKYDILHIYVNTAYNNSLEFKLLAFWYKSTLFIDQNCTYEKVPKSLGRAQKEQQFFS